MGIFSGSLILSAKDPQKVLKTLVFFAVRLRLIPVQGQHLQGPDVRLSPPRGRTQVSKAAGCCHVNTEAHGSAGGQMVTTSVESGQKIMRLEMLLLAQEKSPCSSPAPSPAERSFRGQRSPLSPRFPLVGQTHEAPLYVGIPILIYSINTTVLCRTH